MSIEPYLDEGPRWVVAQAEAELAVRYGDIDASENGLAAAMFEPPQGPSWWPAAAVPPDRLPAGSACAHSGRAWARSERLWVDPAARDWASPGP